MMKNIEMPESFAMQERRRFIRHPLCFPLKYRVMGKNLAVASKETSSRTINISIGGLMFSARKPVDRGKLISIRMPFQNKVFNVRAKVVHCESAVEKKLYNVGVCFYRMNDAFKVKLIEQLYLIAEFRDLWSIQLGREVSLEEASKEWIRRYSKRFERLYW
jgi:c-di-GMP-binding flagellar brake protein YcgR